jgi:hypothetical protein
MIPASVIRRTSTIPSISWSRLLAAACSWQVGLLACLILGAGLRLVWASDMEYKQDEFWTYEQVQRVRHGEPLPMFGMPTSQGALNPGMSLWIFIPLAEMVQARNPVDLARAVQILNVLALFSLAAFGLWIVPRPEREAWLWAAALVAVNPIAVSFHRKIWPPSVFPILVLLFLLAWWHRERRLGAFSWGLIGACLGQIHGSGFFFAAGFALWALLFDRRRTAWGSWFLGSCLGGLGMLPWVHYLLTADTLGPHKLRSWVHLLEAKFWYRWIAAPLGFGLDNSLDKDFADFLRHPLVAGQPTYLGLVLHIAIGVLGAAILLLALFRLRSRWTKESLASMFIGRESATAFTQNAALWGFGLALTFCFTAVARHYLIILFPLQFLWLARMALGTRSESNQTATRGRALLVAMVVCQALVSLQFLSYVHVQPELHGEYGVPYRMQEHTRAIER